MAEYHFEKKTSYHGDNLDSLGGTNSGTVNLIAPQASIWLDEERKSLADGARPQVALPGHDGGSRNRR